MGIAKESMNIIPKTLIVIIVFIVGYKYIPKMFESDTQYIKRVFGE